MALWSTVTANHFSSSGITVRTYLCNMKRSSRCHDYNIVTLTSQNSMSSSGTPVMQKSEARYSTMSTMLSSCARRDATSRVRDRHESQVTSFNLIIGREIEKLWWKKNKLYSVNLCHVPMLLSIVISALSPVKWDVKIELRSMLLSFICFYLCQYITCHR